MPEAAPTPDTDPDRLDPGERLAHYEVVECLGQGSMGIVYRAMDLGLDRPVALKMLQQEGAVVPPSAERFAREARAAARVNHPNLAHVYFVGAHGAAPFFAMELIPGEDLQEAVRLGGPLPLEEAIDVLVQVAQGMAAAHQAGVVHRDLKPSNLRRRPDGLVKVTDFGLCAALGATPDAAARGTIMGTPHYMSPEQCTGSDVDPRADVYALGITAFYLVTGRVPHPGPSLGDVIHQHRNEPLPSVRAHVPDLPVALDEALRWMCAKRPEERPPSMALVAELLEGLRPRRVDRAPLAGRVAASLVDLLLVGGVTAGLAGLLANAGVLVDGPRHVVPLLALCHLLLVGVPESLWHHGAGKWSLEIVVARTDGLPIAWRWRVWRYLLRYGPLLGCGLLALAFPALAWWLLLLGQPFLAGAGVVAFVLTDGETLSDVLTGTAVIHVLPSGQRRKARRAARRDARRAGVRPVVDPNATTRVLDADDLAPRR